MPKRKLLTDTLPNIGRPSRKREKTISPKTIMETRAKTKKMYLMIISFVCRVIICFYPQNIMSHSHRGFTAIDLENNLKWFAGYEFQITKTGITIF
jgi:hypothetical protein